jgi:hypothetical protein
VGLISSGSSREESAFLDASESGGDVFFMTSARLVPQDYDTLFDVYDAHECTALSPCLAVPAALPSACTTESSCRAAATPQPGVFGAPASATFSGVGNLAPSPPPVASRRLTRGQRLARALSACRHRYARAKHRRAACERKARGQYGAKHARHAGAIKGRKG